jgi:hypothetical protein
MNDTLKQTLEENAQYYRIQEQEILAALAGLVRGSIKTKKVKKGTYYYLQYRQGGKVVQRYLGRRHPEEIANQIAQRKQLKKQLRDVRSALKLLGKKPREDLTAPIEDLVVTLANLGLWENGAEIVGSWCFRIYQQCLGVRSFPVRTDDIDILLPLPWKGRALDLGESLRKLGFVEHFHADGSTSYLRPGLKVEFLSSRTVPKKTKRQKLGVVTQELASVDMLLKSPVRIQLMAGIHVRVPAPGAFVIHKLIVADRRVKKDKREKDLVQALSTARLVLGSEEYRDEIRAVWHAMINSWQKKAMRSLERARQDYPMEQGIITSLIECLLQSSSC